jgi:hypothetical protein
MPEIRFLSDGRGFATISEFRFGKPLMWAGREIQVLECEVSIVRPPPCRNIHVMFDILSPRGAQFGGPTTGEYLQNIKQGQSYIRVVPQ